METNPLQHADGNMDHICPDEGFCPICGTQGSRVHGITGRMCELCGVVGGKEPTAPGEVVAQALKVVRGLHKGRIDAHEEARLREDASLFLYTIYHLDWKLMPLAPSEPKIIYHHDAAGPT